MLKLFKKKDKKHAFWSWFVNHKSELENFIQSESRDYTIFNKLSKEIKKFHPQLYAEITMDSDGFVLIVTPDGIKEGIKPTIAISDAAPPIDNWKVKRFRQAQGKVDLNFNGLAFDYSDVKILRKFDLDKEEVNIAVCIKDFDENDQRFYALGFLYLDHVLGEFNVLTRINEIDFMGWDSLHDGLEIIDLLSLRKEIENNLY